MLRLSNDWNDTSFSLSQTSPLLSPTNKPISETIGEFLSIFSGLRPRWHRAYSHFYVFFESLQFIIKYWIKPIHDFVSTTNKPYIVEKWTKMFYLVLCYTGYFHKLVLEEFILFYPSLGYIGTSAFYLQQ